MAHAARRPARRRHHALSGRLRTRHALLLGALHGPAELLPVSSSAHVALVPWLLGWEEADDEPEVRKAFEVALHAGTAAGLVLAAREVLAAPRVAFLALSAAPPAVAGLALERPIERRLGTPRAIAGGLLAGAVALAVAETRARGRRRAADATPGDGLALGLAQAAALVPGVSRSGATLAAARARGFGRADAGTLSREVALPVIAGASGLKLLRVARSGLPPGVAAPFMAGVAAAFASTLAVARHAHAVDRLPLTAAAAYRAALAAAVLRAADRRVRDHPRR